MNPVGAQFDVLAVGHPLLDVIATATEAWIDTEELVKGSRRLIDAETAVELHGRMNPGQETSGGCAASTAVGVVACGSSAAFAGTVARDEAGSTFLRDLADSGVHGLVDEVRSPATGRCLILVTPDGERTMNTCIGAGVHTSLGAVGREGQPRASIVYSEAYLFDNGHPFDVWPEAIDRIRTNGGKFAISLSDRFCVDRHRDDLRHLLEGGWIDICIGNEHEVKALFESDSLERCLDLMGQSSAIGAITLGADGAAVFAGPRVVRHSAEKVDVVDTTGAGDLYAAGFLAGLAKGYDIDRAGRLGIRCAAEIVARVGARLPVGHKVTVS